MSVAFLFAGQGSQYPGMLHGLPDHPVVHVAIRRATEVLGGDALDLDTPEALNSTVAVQLALLIAGTATARTLIAEGEHADFVAGHSAGAFAAAVIIAGTLTFEDAMHLVDLRARSMQAAYPHGYGMCVLIGLEE
jgi:malonate decarboxylase epsilon subunit